MHQRLVEVLGARRVDGDQLDVGGVDPPVPRDAGARPPRPPPPARPPGSPWAARTRPGRQRSREPSRSRCQSHGGSVGSLRAPSARSGFPSPTEQPRGQLGRRAGDHHRCPSTPSSTARSPSTSRSTGHSGLRPIASRVHEQGVEHRPRHVGERGARVEVDGVDPHLAGPYPRHRRRPDHAALHVGRPRRPAASGRVTHDVASRSDEAMTSSRISFGERTAPFSMSASRASTLA